MSDSASEPARESAASADTPPPASIPAATPATSDPAYRAIAPWLRFLIPAALGLAADLWFKAWSFPDGVPQAGKLARIPAGRNPAELYDPSPLIPHVLGFTTTINRGAVFGIAQGYVTFFLAFSIIAMAMILWVFANSRKSQWTVHFALGLITAGALGNLYDRAVYNGVRDMLRFYVGWYPYIFNIADVLLCVGVPLLMIYWLFWGDPRPRKTQT